MGILTKDKVGAAVRAGSGERPFAILWDQELGLGLKLRAWGINSWIVVYRPRNADSRSTPSRTLTLGRLAGSLSLREARARAREVAGRSQRDATPLLIGERPGPSRRTRSPPPSIVTRPSSSAAASVKTKSGSLSLRRD